MDGVVFYTSIELNASSPWLHGDRDDSVDRADYIVWSDNIARACIWLLKPAKRLKWTER
jgi:hypothetical protein